MAALHLTVVALRVGTDKLVPDAQFSSSNFKESRQISFTVGKTVGKLKFIVCLDTFCPDILLVIPLDQLFKEISGGVGGLFGVGCKETQAGELVNSYVLKQAQFQICNTSAWHYLHIRLYPLIGIGHLFIGLGLVDWLLLRFRKQAKLFHDPEQTFRTAGVALLPQPVQ